MTAVPSLGATPTTLAEVDTLFTGSIDASGNLLLTTTMFPALAAALRAAGATQLEVAKAKVDSPAGKVTVDGSGALHGKKAGTVHVEVTDDDGLAVRLQFTAPAGWGFKDAFPDLPPSFGHTDGNPGLVSQGPAVLYDFALATATLTTTSAATTIDFRGALSSADRFTFLKDAFKLPAQPPLNGTIELHAGKPATPDLTIGDGTATLTIGSLLTFDHAGFRAYSVEEDVATGGPLTRLDVGVTLEIGDTAPVPVKLSAPFHELTDVLELTADFGEAGLSIDRGVQAFAELLKLPPKTFELPAPLDVLGKFALQTITTVVSVSDAKVERVAITVGPGVPWPIVDGIEVDDLVIGWAATSPFDSAARTMTASIEGMLTLGTVEPKLQFDVLATTSEGFSVYGGLAHPMTLDQIATTINGAPIHGLPQLTVLNAEVTAQTNGDFAVLVRVGDWHLGDIGSTSIDLVEVSVALQRLGTTLTGQFLTVFGVGTVRVLLQADVKMSQSADTVHAAAGETGWVFKGGTLPGTKISVDELLDELASYGIAKSQVPEPIQSLEITTLDVTYDTAAKKFTFDLTAGFTVATTPVTVKIAIVVQPTAQAPKTDPPATVEGSAGYSATFTGTVAFNKVQFDLVFDVTGTGTDVLIADFVDTGGTTKTDLQGFVATVSSDVAKAIPPGIVVQLDEVKFVYLKQAVLQWAFGVKLGAAINLSELPIVGSRLPAAETLAIEALQLLYASADIGPDQTKVINGVMPSKVTKLPDSVGQGIAFDADVKLGTTTKHFHAGVTPPQPGGKVQVLPPAPGDSSLPATVVGTGAAPLPASASDPVKWLDVNKQFGVFTFERVGLGYEDNRLEFALDASVALGPIAFSMEGLTVGSPLTEFKPEFGLRGLALAFDAPPISIGGAFLKVTETVGGQKLTSYYGELMVEVSQFSLRALGGWAPDAHPASFFIYLNVDAPIGGPPFLFVTGLAGGFGINTSLTLPTIDQVGSYPLLPKAAPKEKGSAAETIKEVIPALQRVFHPEAGEYWVAAGISFTSFEMIDAQAVVSVAFGTELQIGVVGTVSMTFPTGDPEPIAYVEIDVVASFTPSTGLLSVDGKLSPASYLFGGFVKLTGGFAFYAWFSGDHAGDFVVSLGGYHPAFDKPSNYPTVPRLELSFSLGPLKVLGQAYFALVPSGFMAGLRINATFASGPVKAWFDAGIDVLIMWAPFHYDARAWVTIGCSVDLGLFTINVQIGAELEIWGPAFGGTATVDLDVVSFTIGFGADRRPPLPIGWATLEQNFLPQPDEAKAPGPQPVRTLAAAFAAPRPRAAKDEADDAATTNVVKANVTAGQLGTGPAGVDWILDPNAFRIVTSSTVPANHPQWTTGPAKTDVAELPNDPDDYALAPAIPKPAPAPLTGAAYQLDPGVKPLSGDEVWQSTLHIAPMKQKAVDSYFTITLRRYDAKTKDYTQYVVGVTIAPQLSPSNTALWGEAPDPTQPDPNAKRLLPKTLTGLAITPVPRHPDAVSDVPLLDLIFGEGHETGFAYQQPAPDTRYTVHETFDPKTKSLTIEIGGDHQDDIANTGYTLSALTDPWVSAQRDATLTELTALGFDTVPAAGASVTKLAKTALTDWPGAALIGAQA